MAIGDHLVDGGIRIGERAVGKCHCVRVGATLRAAQRTGEVRREGRCRCLGRARSDADTVANEAVFERGNDEQVRERQRERTDDEHE